jgi:hypothetical protein
LARDRYDPHPASTVTVALDQEEIYAENKEDTRSYGKQFIVGSLKEPAYSIDKRMVTKSRYQR